MGGSKTWREEQPARCGEQRECLPLCLWCSDFALTSESPSLNTKLIQKSKFQTQFKMHNSILQVSLYMAVKKGKEKRERKEETCMVWILFESEALRNVKKKTGWRRDWDVGNGKTGARKGWKPGWEWWIVGEKCPMPSLPHSNAPQIHTCQFLISPLFFSPLMVLLALWISSMAMMTWCLWAHLDRFLNRGTLK